MKIKIGNLFDSNDNLIVVTGNSYIKKNTEVVMGKGAALELKKLAPNIAYRFGNQILNICGSNGFYGFITSGRNGLFQVKTHFKDNAELYLVERSTELLNEYILDKDYPTISMNFPGIGNGRLKAELVIPILEKLPDEITIYIKDIKDLK